ncbi:hypothetical protein CQA53_06675 [Helicobacter didelphidarum]|uniref:YggT family protein n=1 Tax=Helicobacter didelphidarum TaxID=2040648 RepID=A0A3D8IK06_9HELI|nr:YggT family protein [Helicobacter didelphidarum]RDU65255.1 hypothetical protein CQA53_06675 [Helicobacter didelphidarum]
MIIILNAIGQILHSIIFIYSLVIFVGAILQLARADPSSNFMIIINRLTYPAYNAIKRIVKTEFNGLEFAPLIVIIILQFVDLTLVRILLGF